MAKQDNITRFTCDRCAKTEYLSQGDPKAQSDWKDATRVTADNAKAQYLFCMNCYRLYRTLTVAQDKDFITYLQSATLQPPALATPTLNTSTATLSTGTPTVQADAEHTTQPAAAATSK